MTIDTEAEPQRVDKFAARRRELAAAAQFTLSERGYANTGLRDIADNSEFSHGVLHYYFNDKDDLITYSVRLYKEECAKRFDDVVATSATADELIDGFRAELINSLRNEGRLHRMWYDLRNQSMFDPAFRDDVTEIDDLLEQMVWRVVTRYGELLDIEIPVSPPVAYAMIDGLFQRALVQQAFGIDAGDELGNAAVAALRSFGR